jgi:integrase
LRDLQLRDDRWVLLDIQGKGRRRRTVPVPIWVKQLLDRWLAASEITEGPLFRTLRKGGTLGPAEAVSEDFDLYPGKEVGRRHRTPRLDAA